MQFALFVQGSPYSSRACHSAYQFTKTLTQSEHSVIGVFFYQDSVLLANALAQPPRDELNLLKEWQQLQHQFHIPLYVCIAAALRRGILNEAEGQRHGADQYTLATGFQLEGLGTWVDLLNRADRIMTFR